MLYCKIIKSGDIFKKLVPKNLIRLNKHKPIQIKYKVNMSKI